MEGDFMNCRECKEKISLYIDKDIHYLKTNIKQILKEYSEFIRPIDDQRSNKEYRKQVSLNLLQDFIETL